MRPAWPAVAVLLAGCSVLSSPDPVRRAAEPARAPVPVTTPAGLVVPVGRDAEGVAVDPVLHVAAIGVRSPFGIALVDTRTGELLRTVPVAGHVRHLALQGHDVLVPLEDAGQLLRISLPTGRVVSVVPTDGYPHGVAAVGPGDAAVGNEHGGRVTLVRDGRVVATARDFPQPGGLAATGRGLYVVDVAAARVTLLTGGGLRRAGSVQAGDGPTHAVADRRGDVVVVDTRGDALLLLGPDLALRRRIHLDGTPYGIAYDPVRDQVWVTLTARNEVVALAGGSLREVRRYATVRQPNTVGVDSVSGTVVVASRTDGTVQLIAS